MDVERVIRKVVELVDAEPDNLYYPPYGRERQYTCGDCTNGTEGSLVGQAVLAAIREVPPVPALDRVERFHESSDGMHLQTLLCVLGIEFEPYQQEWLQWLQNAEHRGETWEQAFESASGTVPRVAKEDWYLE